MSARRWVRRGAAASVSMVVSVALLAGLGAGAHAAPPRQTRVNWPVVPGMTPVAGTAGTATAAETDRRAAAMPGTPAARPMPVGRAEVDLPAAAAGQGRSAPVTAGGLGITVHAVDTRADQTPGTPDPSADPSPGPVTLDPSADPSPGPGGRGTLGGPGRRGSPTAVPSAPGSSGVGRVRVAGLDQQAAQRAGVLRVVTVEPVSGTSMGPVEVGVDLGFLEGAAGDVKARATLVGLPGCAVSTPELPECQVQTPLETTMSGDGSMVLARLAPTQNSLDGSGSVMAVAATASGGTGSFAATPLAASGSWTAGGSSGDFTWSYPFDTPVTADVPGPAVALGYSAQSVDGRTASQNNQTSWVGEGFDLSQGLIERRYKPCAQDQAGGNNPTKTGDLCWGGDNFTVSFGAHSGELVQAGTTHTWRLRDDDGTRFEHVFTAFGNGDDNNEYWKATTPDGTQYFFGRHRANASSAVTNSTWTVPVFGNQPGEPCYTTTFASSSCVQAWRWNLDYVIDPHGGSMTIFYAAETNKYGRNNNQTPTTYTRGGYPVRIEYGQTAGQEHTAPAPARVVFDTAERCLPRAGQTCAETNLSAATKGDWPDVPFDQICTGATCTASQSAPSFFTRKRLTQVRTETHIGGGYQEVEHWNLSHTFPDPGDGYAPALWLSQIVHGAPGMADEAPITFAGEAMANRVEGTTDSLGQVWGGFRKYRVSGIKNAMGGETLVFYTLPECTPTTLPSPESNQKRCFPVWWTPPGDSQTRLQWFHKYVITRVDDYDRTAVNAGRTQTSYTYLDAPAWRWDEGPLTPDSERTWNQWAGYSHVRTVSGDPAAADAQRSEARFFRGLHGDRATVAGGTKTVNITDTLGQSAVDHRALAGQPREVSVFTGATGTLASSSISDYTILPATATSPSGRKAERGAPVKTRTRAVLGSGWRTTETSTRYDALGFPDQVEDLGDTTTTGDDRCTRTSYARNTATWQLDTVATVQTRAVACAGFDTLALTTDNVLTDSRTFYDQLPLGQIGAAGNVTRTETITGLTGGVPTYAAETATYDPLGRVVSASDVLGRSTLTAYTPTGRGLLTATTVTSPDPDGPGPLTPHTTSSVRDPRLGVTTRTVGAGGEVTDAVYDGYARLTQLWSPGRDKATQTPTVTHAYTTGAVGPNTITTRALVPDGINYRTTVAFSDGLGRPAQTQTHTLDQAVDSNGNVTTQPGRLVSTTRYDLRGLAVAEQSEVFAWGAPDTVFQAINDAAAAWVTKTTYDGIGRPTRVALWSHNVEKWASTTTYEGDRAHLTPPPGAAASTTITDARGQVTAVRTYTGAPLSTTYDEISYTYTRAGQLKTHTDPAGNTWTYTYDIRGNQIAATDPDTGTSTRTYDAAGQQLTATNAKNETLATTYDALGRKTSLRDTSPTGPLRAEWTYDTVRVGQPTASTRWVAGQPVRTEVTAYDAAARPTATQTTVPVIPGWVDAPLAKTYKNTYTYTADGQPALTRLMNYGPLVGEQLTHRYDTLGRPVSLGGLQSYVAGTLYSGTNNLVQMFNGPEGQLTFSTYTYDPATNRTATARFNRQTHTQSDAHIEYGYTPAGSLTRIHTTHPNTGAPADTQCFTNDHQDRLTRAWTPATGNCATTPSAAGLGGPAPYWLDWTYDKASNRLSETSHTTTGDRVTTWAVPGTGTKPHQATAQTLTPPGQAPSTTALTYDPAGNITTRTTTPSAVPGQSATAAAQTLTHDPEGRLATVVQNGQTTRYAYHPDGARLIRRDNTTTVLSLGETELTLNHGTQTVTPQRYIQYAGMTVAVRTGTTADTVHTLWSEINNTATWQVRTSDSTITTRRTLPFGAPRGPEAIFAGDRGFVQGLNDPGLGLIRIGARDYDPATGRFLQPDPLLDTTTPNQWNPYSYANNNPLNQPDPTGLRPDDYTAAQWSAVLREQAAARAQSAARQVAQIWRDATPYGKHRLLERQSYGTYVAPAKPKNVAKKPLSQFQENAANYRFYEDFEVELCETDPGFREHTHKMTWLSIDIVTFVIPVGPAIKAARLAGVAVKPAVTAAKPLVKQVASRVTTGAARACSFSGETLVLMGDGTHKPIDQIEVGDTVLATDPETGEQAPQPVDHVFAHEDDVSDIVINGETITTTEDHPFWSVTDQRFEPADELQPGEHVLAANGTLLTITHYNPTTTRTTTAYNLSVQNIHTYHVGTHNTLVHNTGHTCGIAAKGAGAVADDWPVISGIVRDAAKGKGNFGIGSGTAAQAETAGRSWVGDGARLASDGKTWLSQDGLRQWRPPSYKPRLDKWQSNFESRWEPSGQWQTNGHLDILDMP